MPEVFIPGFYQDVSFHDYLADSALNNSGLKIFSQSPAKFAYWRDNEKPGTPTQVEGSALHCAILQPELFENQFGKGPAPRVGSAGRIKWDKANPKAIPLTPRQFDNVQGMSQAFEHTSCSVARDLLAGGTPEMSIFWDDPGTHLVCKMRPDYLRADDIMIDLKSSQAGSPQGFLREVRRWGYDRQAAWYERGLNAAYQAAGVNRRVEAFIFIVVENFSPYETAIYMLSDEIIETARQQIDIDLEKYIKCIKNNVWPGYVNEIVILGADD
ncbi:PD-(D/E)XK nuclease-like domain-containing protein [candidate division WOR-3 bacterium]|nr:PD-(D/E)XK nuclease-like domain-containing protein [candidate division WOR-3 bacterium]